MEHERGTIRAKVAEASLEYNDGEPISFFNDLMTHGCASGMVNFLIYYVDTHSFFDEHYDAIEELRIEYLEDCGEPLRIDGDLKNTLAWFGFEETAQRMMDELDL